MAECIPAQLPPSADPGEKKVFNWLRELPPDCLVYHEPAVGHRYPDFIVILPTLGLLVIEVKTWKLDGLREANAHEFHFADPAGKPEQPRTAPLRQVREYALRLLRECQAHDWGRALLHATGERAGQMRIPVASLCVFLGEKRARLAADSALAALLPPERVLAADEWHALAGKSPEQRLAALARFFDLFPLTSPLTPGDVAVLRAIIHPEVRIGRAAPGDGEAELRVLDFDQERAAVSLGEGHRLVFGAAGSGKTVLLIARARLLARQGKRVLVVCFNVPLRWHLEGTLADCAPAHANAPGAHVVHFHEILHQAGVPWTKLSPAEQGERLRAALDEGGADNLFDALLIDEAQDFEPSWIQALLRMVRTPAEADVLIVGDGNQGIFGRKQRPTWASLGVQAAGGRRTQYLRRPYRSSHEIIRLAARFVRGDGAEGEVGVAAVAADPALATRASGHRPHLAVAKDRAHEREVILRAIKGLLAGRWAKAALQRPLRPSEIAVLYPPAAPGADESVAALRAGLKKMDVPSVWMKPGSPERRKVHAPGVKLTTIGISKGLQFRAVLLMHADALPSPRATAPADDRLLLYVALTRAEDFLLVTATADQGFMRELIASGEAEVSGASPHLLLPGRKNVDTALGLRS